jgi:hypothetical protein
MRILFRILVISIIMLTLTISGCYYDNEEDLYLGSNVCDTTNVTYSGSVSPVLAGYCSSCHGGSTPQANISIDNYTSVVANISRIRGAINHESGFSPMPQSGGKISVCDLTKIDIWINQGMPNN